MGLWRKGNTKTVRYNVYFCHSTLACNYSWLSISLSRSRRPLDSHGISSKKEMSSSPASLSFTSLMVLSDMLVHSAALAFAEFNRQYFDQTSLCPITPQWGHCTFLRDGFSAVTSFPCSSSMATPVLYCFPDFVSSPSFLKYSRTFS